MKKVLLVDTFTHTFLKDELKNYRIDLLVESDIDNLSQNFDAVIFVINEKKEIFSISKKINMFINNIIIMVNDVDAAFIRYCNSIGVKDIIKTPYSPNYTAKRIENLICGNTEKKQEKSESCHNILKKYIKDAYIKTESISIIGCKFIKVYDKYVYKNDVLKIIKENLRDIDYAEYYNDTIIMIIPNCNKAEINHIIQRMKSKINCCHMFFDYITKKRINIFDLLISQRNIMKKLEIFLEKGIIADRELVAQDIIQNQLYSLYSKIV